MSARFRIDGIDVGPDDLPAQLPREGALLRQVPGPDRPDYFLGVLDAPLTYRTTLDALRENGVDPASADPRLIRIEDDGTVELGVFGVCFAARIVGQAPHAGMRDFPVMLAYVVDNSVMRDETIDFSKLVYSAVAFLSDATPAEG